MEVVCDRGHVEVVTEDHAIVIAQGFESRVFSFDTTNSGERGGQADRAPDGGLGKIHTAGDVALDDGVAAVVPPPADLVDDPTLESVRATLAATLKRRMVEAGEDEPTIQGRT